MPLTAPLYTDAFPMDPAPAQSAMQARALDRFLRGIERRALRIAELSTRDREDALELVQDAMLAFARSYADKPEADWAPLFHRVLDSRILDHHRRGQVRRLIVLASLLLWSALALADGTPWKDLPPPPSRSSHRGTARNSPKL